MAAALGGEVVTDLDLKARDLSDVDAVVAVWWRSAEPLLARDLPPGLRLILCLYDHQTSSAGNLWGRLVQGAHAVTVCNRTLGRELLDRGVRTVYLPDGVDCDRFAGKSSPGTRRTFRVGWIGDGLAKVKRLPLVRQVGDLLRPHGVELSIADRRQAPIPFSEMPDHYAALDAVLCVSEMEGTPNPILEGCASGLPYISTPVGLVPEIHAETSGGVMLSRDPTPDEVVAAILRLRDSRSELSAMGRRNREQMLWAYKWNFAPLCRAIEGKEPTAPEAPPDGTTYQAPSGYCPSELRVLMVCTQPPGWGGAATGWYGLISALRREGVHAVGAFIDNWDKVPEGLTHDPDGIGGILRIETPARGQRVQVRGAWDLVLCKNHKAHEHIDPEGAPMVYVTSSVAGLSMGGNHRIARRDLFPPGSHDRAAFQSAAAVVVHSSLDHSIYCQGLPSPLVDKIAGRSIPLPDVTVGVGRGPGRPYRDRAFDFCFIASHWGRSVKNGRLLREICEAYPDARIAVCGLGFESSNPNHSALGLIPHGQIFDLLGDSRALVIPSHYDSSPGVYAEGIAMGCDVVVGPTVGNTDAHPPKLRAASATLADFRPCLNVALRKRAQGKYRKIDPRGTAREMARRLWSIYATGAK